MADNHNIWSHDFDTTKINEKANISIEANDSEKKALAGHIDVEAVSFAKADFTLTQPRGAHAVKVQGSLKAEVQQICVVTLEPITVQIDEEFEAYYADYSQATPFAKAKKKLYAEYGMDDIPVMEEDEDPESMKDGIIDLGELAMQYLSLSVNPYPHKQGLEKDVEVITAKTKEGEGQPEPYKNPFEALRELQDTKSKKS